MIALRALFVGAGLVAIWQAVIVAFDPPPVVDASKRGASVFRVDAGSTVRFRVIARFDDGSTQDVTADEALEIEVFSPLVLLPAPGQVLFAQVAQAEAAALSVNFGGAVRLLSFVVHP